MKKHKIKIPEGYEVTNEYSGVNGEGMIISITLEPIKKELPKTWAEFYNRGHDNWKGQIEVTGPMHDEFTALWKLILLRDHYNDGWAPDWKNGDQAKYGISILNGHAIVDKYNLFSVVLSFKFPELRDEFLSNFRALIEIAKPLL